MIATNKRNRHPSTVWRRGFVSRDDRQFMYFSLTLATWMMLESITVELCSALVFWITDHPTGPTRAKFRFGFPQPMARTATRKRMENRLY